MHFEKLPIELLVTISEFLDDISIFRFTSTNKLLRSIRPLLHNHIRKVHGLESSADPFEALKKRSISQRSYSRGKCSIKQVNGHLGINKNFQFCHPCMILGLDMGILNVYNLEQKAPMYTVSNGALISCLQIAVGDVSGIITLYDLHSGKLLRRLNPQVELLDQELQITAIEFSSSTLISGDKSGNIRVYDCNSGQFIKRFTAESSVCNIKFDSSLIVVGCEDGSVTVFNYETQLTRLEGDTSPVSAMTFDADGFITIWNLNTLSGSHFKAHERQVTCIQIIYPTPYLRKSITHSLLKSSECTIQSSKSIWPDQNLQDDGIFLSSSNDKTIKAWNASTQQCIFVFRGHTAPIAALELDQNDLYSIGYDGVVIKYDYSTGKVKNVESTVESSMLAVFAFTQDQ